MDVAVIASRIALWLVVTLAIFVAARLLGSKAIYTINLRATGFAHSVEIVELLGIVAPLASVTRILTHILLFFGVWMGASEANDLRGWRSVGLPVVVVVITVVGMFVLRTLFQGAALTFEALLRDLGVAR